MNFQNMRRYLGDLKTWTAYGSVKRADTISKDLWKDTDSKALDMMMFP